MHEKYHKWYTSYLSRTFEMLEFGHAGYPVIVFPTSKGRYFQTKDAGLIETVAPLIDAGKVRLFCPDSVDELSWYNFEITPADRVKTHMAYEDVILNDVIGFALRESGHESVGVAGCSFGGYHAANIAFRHPDRIRYLFTMGGAFDIKQFIFGFYDENCYFNNPTDYLANLTDSWYLERIRRMGIILGTGEWDMCLSENRFLSTLLTNREVRHWLDVRRGAGHDWPWWKEMFPHYISQINEVQQR